MGPEEAYVLVIEDNANNLMVTTDFLRMIGVKYINARASGWQALKLAENLSRVDLILLDLQLPYEDGYTVLGRIRANPKLRDTRVVAVTANVFPQEEVRARKAGFNGFIGKPLDMEVFPRQIQALLAGQEIWMMGTHR
jgi:two-component system, cell cycle response regulator DivK